MSKKPTERLNNHQPADNAADLSRPAPEEPPQQNIGRDRVLARLWELASLSHEVTRNSISGQIKALSMIVNIEGLAPDRRAAQNQPASTTPKANIFKTPWLMKAEAKAAAEAAGFLVIEREEATPETPDHDSAVNPSPAPETGRSISAQPSWGPNHYQSFVPNATYR
jgi:hypothetical protein